MSYRNPVIPGFHPDPSICRVGEEYFLAVSSFTYFPGVPIFRSTDLVTWTQIGNALDRPSQLDLTGTETYASGGVFAPTLRHHDGRYWMITTVLASGGLRSFFVTAEDPAGPWSDPVDVDVPGIDPDLAWDDHGNLWIHCGLGAIYRSRIDPHTGEALEVATPTWSGTGLHAPEAPHLLRRDGTWYLLIAEGGTERGHGVSIARGPSPTGPWEGCPANPILSHRSTGEPIQNTGHADLVEAPDGSWWMVLLGARPLGTTPRYHVLGRETFLVPIDWVDGWPVPRELELDMPVDPPGPPTSIPASTAGFDVDHLDAGWISVRRELGDAVSLTERPGWLTLHGDDDGPDDPYPTFVGRRQVHEEVEVRTTVEVTDAREAGLCVRMDEGHHVEIAVAETEVVARMRVGPVAEILGRTPRPPGAVTLRVDAVPDPDVFTGAPDLLRLGVVRAHGQLDVLAEVDGRYLSTEVAGGFIGRVIGVYAVGGTAAFGAFEMVDASS